MIENENDEGLAYNASEGHQNENDPAESDMQNMYMDHNQQEMVVTNLSSQRPPPYQLHPNVKAGSRSGLNNIASDIKQQNFLSPRTLNRT